MSETDPLVAEAQALKQRLEAGLASPEEVQLWADAWMYLLEMPPPALEDLAALVRTDRDTVLALLRDLVGG